MFMNSSFKPSGYNSVSPYFIVDDALRFAEFLKKLFNAVELRRYAMPDGTIMHMEMQMDDSVIMLGNSSKQYPAIHQLVHVYVSDAATTFKKAIELGCTSLQEPKQMQGDPDVRGTFQDFAGNTWSVGTQQ
jgi:PhnB protein